MNIAFFSKHLPSDHPNGVSVQVDRLADALVERGHDVTCFSFSPRPETARYNHIPLSWGTSFGLCGALASGVRKKFIPALEFRKINKTAFDICHYHGDDYLCRGSASRVRTFYGSALFEALHAKKPGRFLYQLLFYKLEWLSCFRKGTLAGISRLTKRALPLIRHVVPCGVPLDRFAPPATSMKSGHPSILFIGDFKSRKQGSLLLNAFSRTILPRFPDAVLTVIGPVAIEAKNVRCLGRLGEPELIDEYRRAWIYCLPSSYEGFGVPVIEAFGCGTAVVALESPGMREIIENGSNGILCEPDKLGDSIITALENAELRNMLVREGLEKAKEYDIRIIAERYEEYYKKAILSGKKK
jgi:phosphatidyl-myo-inositol alpha-mannosyltransferase